MKVSLKKTVPVPLTSSVEIPLEVTVSGNVSQEQGWIINYRDIKQEVLAVLPEFDSDELVFLEALWPKLESSLQNRGVTLEALKLVTSAERAISLEKDA